MSEKVLWKYALCCLNNENCCSNNDTKQVLKAMLGNYFRFLIFKGKRFIIIIFFLFSKWKTRLVSWKEKHIFQKQNSRNLFGSCFWKSWILFCLVNFFFLNYIYSNSKHICSKVFKILTPRRIIKSNVLYITFKPETLII